MDILKFFKNVFVINLDRRPDRLEDFYSRIPFDKNSVTRISAVDGKNITFTYRPEEKINPYVIGCHRSHKNILQSIVNNNNYEECDLFLIFEDDVFFSSNFKDKIKQINLIDKSKYFIFYIGGRFNLNFEPSSLTGFQQVNENIYEKLGNYKNIKGSDYDRTTHSYIINKKTARKILEKTTVVKESEPVDSLYNNIRKYAYDIKIYDIFPHICYSPLLYKTDIQNFSSK